MVSKTCVPTNYSMTGSATSFGWEGWFVIVVLIILFLTLFNNWVPIEFAIVASALVLMTSGIITIAEGLAGFANSGILAVACLFIVAEGLASTGAVDYFMGRLLGAPKTLGGALFRMMLPPTFVAAWISSTAVVALMIPVVQRWSRKINRPPSQLMLPMCFAVHLGGTCTLVGTTTNLVVSGLVTQNYCYQMGIFELSKVGVPVAISGLGFIILLTPKLLPNQEEYDRRTNNYFTPKKHTSWRVFWARVGHRLSCGRCCSAIALGSNEYAPPVSDSTHAQMDALDHIAAEPLMVVEGHEPMDSSASKSDFVVHARIPPDSSLHGKSVEASGLRQLHGLFLVSVQRERTLFSAVGPGFELAAGDVLSFAGITSGFVGFCRDKGLLVVSAEDIGSPSPDLESAAPPITQYTIEAVVRSGSALIGKTPKEVGFRVSYDASILSIHRAGERLSAPRLGRVALKVGDVLLLLQGEYFDWNAPDTSRDLKPRMGFVPKTQARGLHNRDTPSPSDATTATNSALPGPDDHSSLSGLAGALDGIHEEVVSHDAASKYLFSMRISKSAQIIGIKALDGQTVESSGLRSIAGIRLVAIQKEDALDRSIGPDTVLCAGDIVWFAGDRDALASLRRVPGLEDVEKSHVDRLDIAPQHRRLVELVISLNSELLYKTVRESRFRTRFGGAIVGVRRQGRRVFAKIGDIILEPGDVLVVDAGPNFVKLHRNNPNFLVITELAQSTPPRFDRFYICLAASLAMVVVTATTGVDLVLPAAWATGVLLASRVLTRDRAHSAIDWKIIITVAAAFGLSAAMTNTNVGNVLGTGIVTFAVQIGMGDVGVLAIVMIFTEILCALITAKAGAIVMFPIAAAAANRLNINPNRMSIALMLGSSDYTTPQGHQTNLMVYGPGGYTFRDYIKFGIPFEILLNIVQIVGLAYWDQWYLVLIGSFVVLIVCVLIDHLVVERLPLSDLYLVWSLRLMCVGDFSFLPSALRCCRAKRDGASGERESDPALLDGVVKVDHGVDASASDVFSEGVPQVVEKPNGQGRSSNGAVAAI